jgi:hypothetical protein
MTVQRLLALALRLLVGVVLVVSGAYLLIYLYRWEWNRAIISGVFFVAAEVALATSVILQHLRAVEQRSTVPDRRAGVLDRVRSAPVDRPNPFAWLDPRSGRLGVFVPVLLGAGAILSALAYVVERIAEATALPIADRRLATRMAAIELPAGGLRGGAPAARPERAPRHPGVIVASVVAAAGVAVLVWLALLTIMDATQARPDPADRPVRTTIDLTIERRRTAFDTVDAAEALWVDCRSTLGSLPVSADVIATGGSGAQLVLEPGIGRLSARRLTGCLTDLRLNRIRASVVEVESIP